MKKFDLARGAPYLPLVGLLSAFVVTLELNVLAARHHQRWDLSATARFSISEATREFLESQTSPTEIVVLLGSTDPLLVDVRHVIDAYLEASPHLSARYIDPERNSAEFLALGKQVDVSADETSDGKVVAEAALVVRSGTRSWFVRAGELIAVDAEGRRTPRLEAALTEALARVGGQTRAEACFITGHGEKSIADFGPEGLSELARHLEHLNVTAREVDVERSPRELAGCDLVALIAPARPLPPANVELLRAAVLEGSNLLALIDPIVDGRGTVTSPGLDALFEANGTKLEPGFVLEQADRYRLPQGLGEAFVAQTLPHPLTRGLSPDDPRPIGRVIVQSVQPLAAVGDGAALLRASSASLQLRRLDAEETESTRITSPGDGPVIAIASRGARASGKRERRAVIVGTSSFADNTALRDPALYGSRVLLDRALGWTTARPAAVSIPDARPLPAGLTLTEESLGALLRYVLVYLPLTAALSGAFVLVRRHQREQRSRGAAARLEKGSA